MCRAGGGVLRLHLWVAHACRWKKCCGWEGSKRMTATQKRRLQVLMFWICE